MRITRTPILLLGLSCAALKEAIGAGMIVHDVPLWLGGRMMIYGGKVLPITAACLIMVWIGLGYAPPGDTSGEEPPPMSGSSRYPIEPAGDN